MTSRLRPFNEQLPGAHSPSPDGSGARTYTVLDLATWTELERRHHLEVDELTAGHRSRTDENRSHPVEDFLFTYYTLRPAQLRRWHPGAGIALLDAADRAQWRFHRLTGPSGGTDQAVTVDVEAYLVARGKTVTFVRELLTRTAATPGQFGCFGLHEWAMVYRTDERRHLAWPLRLGQGGTDEVVENHQLRCTHFDAFRFFTPDARPRNLLAPDLSSRDRLEQPGCLHTSMDLYKWAYRLGPLISGSLLLDCFRLAKRIREVDMRASPYDLRGLGYEPITIETPAGKNEYVASQRDFAASGQQLRRRLLTELDHALVPDSSHDVSPTGIGEISR